MSAIIANTPQHPAVPYNSILEKRPALTQNISSSANKSVSLLSSGQKLTEDVHTMEPDDMFARHTVYEMKSILHRLRYSIIIVRSSLLFSC